MRMSDLHAQRDAAYASDSNAYTTITEPQSNVFPISSISLNTTVYASYLKACLTDTEHKADILPVSSTSETYELMDPQGLQFYCL